MFSKQLNLAIIGRFAHMVDIQPDNQALGGGESPDDADGDCGALHELIGDDFDPWAHNFAFGGPNRKNLSSSSLHS